MCESGADVMLPDVEGNRAIDMARKNKHSKCVNYLEQVMKRAPRVNGSVMVGWRNSMFAVNGSVEL